MNMHGVGLSGDRALWVEGVAWLGALTLGRTVAMEGPAHLGMVGGMS